MIEWCAACAFDCRFQFKYSNLGDSYQIRKSISFFFCTMRSQVTSHKTSEISQSRWSIFDVDDYELLNINNKKLNIPFGIFNNILLFKMKIEQRARAPCRVLNVGVDTMKWTNTVNAIALRHYLLPINDTSSWRQSQIHNRVYRHLLTIVWQRCACNGWREKYMQWSKVLEISSHIFMRCERFR